MSHVSRRGFIGGVAAGAAAAGVTGGAVGAVAGDPLPAQAAADVTGAGTTRLDNRMRTDRQWAEFLGAQDLRWGRLAVKWYDAPFLGNGLLGTLVYAEPGRNAVRFTVQHSRVQDHRPQFGDPNFGIAKLPVGHFTLEPVGEITGVDLRLDLWNAELRGTITTRAGRLAIRALVHNDRSVLVVRVTPSGGEHGYRWVFHPAESISPKALQRPNPAGYTGNPAPTLSTDGGINVVTQPLLAGGAYVTAHRRVGDRLLCHVVPPSAADTARREAVAAVRRAAAASTDALTRTHRRWWNAYYPKSFLSVPDAKLQSFYWIQLYKVASATRDTAPVMSTSGPWLEPTPWPAHWWNLNAQLEYWLIYGANHLELDALTATLARNRQQLVANTPEAYRTDSLTLPRVTNTECDSGSLVGVPGAGNNAELGDLTWALHNVWLTYRHSMDDALLRDTIFPLLRGAINYYLHFLAPGPDGRLHLPPTVSPEYGEAPDCHYDLALIRWGCRTLLDACDRLRRTDPLQPTWRDVLANLVDYPVDANGFMVGTGVPFAKSHRHYSHMLAVYPLYLVNADQPANRDLIDRTLKHWISFEGALQGYSFTGAASIAAGLGRGNEALGHLSRLVRTFIKAATMYKESGPVIETPLSGCPDDARHALPELGRHDPDLPGGPRRVGRGDPARLPYRGGVPGQRRPQGRCHPVRAGTQPGRRAVPGAARHRRAGHRRRCPLARSRQRDRRDRPAGRARGGDPRGGMPTGPDDRAGDDHRSGAAVGPAGVAAARGDGAGRPDLGVRQRRHLPRREPGRR